MKTSQVLFSSRTLLCLNQVMAQLQGEKVEISLSQQFPGC